MTLQLKALIEQWGGGRLLYVRDLPGFVVNGASTAELAGRTNVALRKHLEWLVSKDLIEEPEGEIDLQLSEEINAAISQIGPRFDADLFPPDEHEVEAALAVGRAALSDLIDAFDVLPASISLDRAVHTFRHLATLDRWYASRLGVVSLDLLLPDPIDDLVSAAGTFEDAVDSLAGNNLSELLLIDGEEWTLAKALRRRTGHLREHLSDLQPDDVTE